MIAHRKHIGNVLAEGVAKAAKIIGKGTEKYAIHIKGLEAPAHDVRAGKMLGIAYATGNRGMCHIHPLEGTSYDYGKMDWGMAKYGVRDPNTLDRWDEEGKGRDCARLQNALIAPDILSTCKFFMYAGVSVDEWASMLAAATGWDIDGRDIIQTGERVYNLQRLFNMREGYSRKDDRLPERILQKPRFGAYAEEDKCIIHDFDAMLNEYYDERKWDRETGCPTEEKLEELDLTAYR
jgi:aldehyde:ferredoxin oxidoreductase